MSPPSAARCLVDAASLSPATLTPPPSKSDAQRALALAHALGDPSLAELPFDDDALPDDVKVLRRGLEILRTRPGAGAYIDCHDGGAPFRILLGQAAATPGAFVRLVGSARLGQRPHRPLLEALRTTLGPAGLVLDEGSPWPITVRGAARTPEPRFAISASESSQFPTSLLLAAAGLVVRERRPWTVTLTGPTASRGYLELTLAWLARMGFATEVTDSAVTLLDVRAPSSKPVVPGDWSSIGYLLLVAWASGGAVALVDKDAAHPDRAILRVLEEAGLYVDDRPGGLVAVTGSLRAGLSASGEECPDLLPTLAALACVAPSDSTFTEVSILRHKESDRLEGIRDLVRAGGGTTTLEGDVLVITPGQVPARMELSSRGDHRLAMAAATLAALGRSTLVLEGPEHVTKSFPAFWSEVERAGVRVATS